jgi:hypothetical protein
MMTPTTERSAIDLAAQAPSAVESCRRARSSKSRSSAADGDPTEQDRVSITAALELEQSFGSGISPQGP